MVSKLRSVLSRRDTAIGMCLGAVTVIDHDRDRARAIARREVAPYLKIVASLDPTADAQWLRRIANTDADTVALATPDEMLDRFAFAGTPADIVRQVENIFAAGATRVEFGTPLGPDPISAIRLLGERVLPAFR
jgi:5,10-methylenetetrahydromethanopterin reductase